MVLKIKAAIPLSLLILLGISACIQPTRPLRMSEQKSISLTMLMESDQDAAVQPLPAPLPEAIEQELEAHNLQVITLTQDKLADFATLRDTQRRIEASATGDAPFVLLIESRAKFFSQLNGRYKWQVYYKLTLAEKGELHRALRRDFEFSAILRFDHQKEKEAVAASKDTLTKELRNLLNRFLAGRGAEPPPPEVSEEDPTIKKPSEAADSNSVGGLQSDLLYFVLVDRFDNGDSSNDANTDLSDPHGWHGGDLQGVMQHLDELQDLGVQTLWLSPVFLTQKDKFHGHGAFHAYWTHDLNIIDPRFGGETALGELAAEVHKRGMRLYLDMVLNHVGYDAPLIKNQPDWFHPPLTIEDWSDAQQLTDRQVHGLPDLDQSHPEVATYLLDASVRWQKELHLDGFRLDAVKHIPYDFWKKYSDKMQQSATNEFALLAEIFDGNPAELSKVQNMTGFDQVFDFPLYYALTDVFCRQHEVSKLASTIFADRAYDDAATLVTFLDNHDLPRIASLCPDINQVHKALAFQFAMRGTPSISWGTEIGLQGKSEPENRGDMRFEEMQGHPTHTFLKRLTTLRAEKPWLKDAPTRILDSGKSHLVLSRIGPGESLVIVLNQSKKTLPVTLPAFANNPEIIVGEAEWNKENKTLQVSKNTLVLAMLKADSTALFDKWTDELLKPQSRTVRFVLDSTRQTKDEVHLVGLGSEFGDWNAKTAPRFEQQAGQVIHEITLPTGGVFAYKLVRIKNDKVIWEKRDNRYLFVKQSQTPLEVNLRWEN